MGVSNPEEGIWRETLRAHSYDVDFRKRATGQAICSWFLEAAWNHAEQLGFGYRELAARGLLWVLSRLVIEIECFPEWGELIQLSTWPRGTNGAWALRGWLMARLAGLEFTEKVISPDDPAMKAEILLLSPSMRVPALPVRTTP